ncbi:MAG: relaxase/mobilization nuclease domain-containing protein [Pseudomonadota bacterium]
MILVGNQRGGARDLALHLMKDENDHVTVHEVRGFASGNLQDALHEAYAVSRGTKCKQFLFSLSLNPPKEAEVDTATFEQTVDRAETQLGLNGQPRAIVFHEKDGRRHAHAVWSRIDIDEMKAVQLSFTKKKLQTLSRDLYLENGWKMPHGLADQSRSDPRNFTLAEWQQAKRVNKDPRDIKKAIQDAWAISDSRAGFEHALEERGYRLAQGDRRGFVAVDHNGEPYAVARQAGVKTKDVKARLGDPKELPTLDDMRGQVANDMLSTMQRFQKQLDAKDQQRRERFEGIKDNLVQKQRLQRAKMQESHEQRQISELKERQSRFRSGLGGVWDKLRGEHQRIQKQNELEALQSLHRDRAEQHRMILSHLDQRRRLDKMQVTDQLKRDELQAEIAQDKQAFQAKVPEPERDKKNLAQTEQAVSLDLRQKAESATDRDTPMRDRQQTTPQQSPTGRDKPQQPSRDDQHEPSSDRSQSEQTKEEFQRAREATPAPPRNPSRVEFMRQRQTATNATPTEAQNPDLNRQP